MAAKVEIQYAVQQRDPATGRWVTGSTRPSLVSAERMAEHYTEFRIVTRTVTYSPWKAVK